MLAEDTPPRLYPQTCLLTRRSGGRMCDTGVTLEAGQPAMHVYIREEPIKEMAQKIGMITPGAYKEEKDARIELEASVAELEEKIERAERNLNIFLHAEESERDQESERAINA